MTVKGEHLLEAIKRLVDGKLPEVVDEKGQKWFTYQYEENGQQQSIELQLPKK